MSLFDGFKKGKTVSKSTQATAKNDSDLMLELLKINAEMEKNNRENGENIDLRATQKPDYGYSIDNPIYMTNILMSYMYLDRLTTAKGEPLTYKRIGAVHPVGGAIVDKYQLFLNGDPFKVIFICPYGKMNTNTMPAGLKLK